jgi:hypothetical protein
MKRATSTVSIYVFIYTRNNPWCVTRTTELHDLVNNLVYSNGTYSRYNETSVSWDYF